MWRLLLVFCAVGLGLAACGDGNGDVRPPEPTLESPAEELMRRASRFEEAEYQATYEMYAEFGDAVIEGTFTWYQMDGAVRGDFAGQAGGVDSDVIVIPGPGDASGSLHFVCHVAGEACVESRPEGEEVYRDGQYPVVLGSGLISAEEFGEAFAVATTFRERIAGQEAACFVAPTSVHESFKEGEVCVTEDGVVLRVIQESRNGDTASVHAIDFSRDVDDEVFELPYQLVETSTPKERRTTEPPATISLVRETPVPLE